MRTRALALMLALGSFSLVACGGGDDDDAGDVTTTTEAVEETTTTTEADEETTTTTPGDGQADGDLTAPGSELALGTTAKVLYVTDAGDEVPLEVTVTAIDKGDPADMADFDLGEDAGKVPWYVRLTVTNPTEVDLSDENITLGLEAYDDRNDQLGLLILVGDFPTCENDNAPAGFSGGATYEVCEPYLVHPDGAVSAAFWNELDTDYFDAPVIWRAG